jgi:hypothetical protein
VYCTPTEIDLSDDEYVEEDDAAMLGLGGAAAGAMLGAAAGGGGNPNPAGTAKAAAPKITFSVIELTGKELPMTMLSALHTVGELKQEVARASGMRAERLRLVLDDQPLDDQHRTLGECGVVTGSQVNAVSQSVESRTPPPLAGLDRAKSGIANIKALRSKTPPRPPSKRAGTPPRASPKKDAAAAAAAAVSPQNVELYTDEWYAMYGNESKQKSKSKQSEADTIAHEAALMAEQLTFDEDGDGALDEEELSRAKQAEEAILADLAALDGGGGGGDGGQQRQNEGGTEMQAAEAKEKKLLEEALASRTRPSCLSVHAACCVCDCVGDRFDCPCE